MDGDGHGAVDVVDDHRAVHAHVRSGCGRERLGQGDVDGDGAGSHGGIDAADGALDAVAARVHNRLLAGSDPFRLPLWNANLGLETTRFDHAPEDVSGLHRLPGLQRQFGKNAGDASGDVQRCNALFVESGDGAQTFHLFLQCRDLPVRGVASTPRRRASILKRLASS